MSLELPITDYIDTHFNTISSQTPITEAGQKMMELGVDSVLVLENNEISGIVTQLDIMKAISKNLKISDSVQSIANVGQAIKVMRENNIRRLVVKKDSKAIGTITQKKIFGSRSSNAFEIPELEMPEKIKCPYCSSLFQKKGELSKHVDQIHIGYGVFQGNFSKADDLGGISAPSDYPKSL
jgi:signal-transduction protein with cAMP-binding, CBS, and nucleotidyltransferase domain